MAYTLRLIAFLAICVMVVWVALEVVSLALGTTQFGTSTSMKPAVALVASWLLWSTLSIMVAHRAKRMFLGLMARLEL